jgi:hypothetical protein
MEMKMGKWIAMAFLLGALLAGCRGPQYEITVSGQVFVVPADAGVAADIYAGTAADEARQKAEKFTVPEAAEVRVELSFGGDQFQEFSIQLNRAGLKSGPFIIKSRSADFMALTGVAVVASVPGVGEVRKEFLHRGDEPAFERSVVAVVSEGGAPEEAPATPPPAPAPAGTN